MMKAAQVWCGSCSEEPESEKQGGGLPGGEDALAEISRARRNQLAEGRCRVEGKSRERCSRWRKQLGQRARGRSCWGAVLHVHKLGGWGWEAMIQFKD